ncbi:MAG: Cobalt-zinc-cadmium resistance protein CzcA [Myxococcaceae bacterium]|nr:Cobalt-zinc-cadmium resistance protein CzcA [Myxococcaceae bacterium]
MVEKIIEFCAKNRFIVLLGVGFAMAGAVWSIKNIKLDAIPDLSDPQVIIFTEWMGQSPTLVEDQVTYPIVSSLLSAPHVTDVRGFSMFGMSFVYVIFEEGTDVYWARSRVLEYLSGIRSRLPAKVEPQIGPDATGIGWVFQYALVDKSGKHGLDDLRTYQDFNLRYALGSVPGVAEVASVGGYEKQYQVTVDPARLRAHDVTLEEVIGAIRDSNNDVGGRMLEMSGREYYVRGRGYIQNLAQLENIAIRAGGPSGIAILVKDIGQVRFGPEIRRGLLEWNGEGEAVGGIVVMRYGENALDVIERVKQRLKELAPSIPEGVTVEIAYDRSDLIQRSVETLKHSLIEEAIVVSLIIIVFLLHLRSALLPILSLPISVALSFIPMYLLDIPSTIMSLGGIAIAIGATVDAEIVMIEASHKKLEEAGPGADRHKLLAEAAREVTPAIFFSLLIIAVAFLPVFTLTGQAGRLFKPLAYTKTFVMLFSAILSITFAPALRDVLIRGKIFPEHRHPISRFMVAIYKPFVFVALRKPKSTIAIGLLALVSAVPLALELGHEFMPPLNEGDVLYMPITFPNISIEEAKRQLQKQDQILKTFPEVATVFGKVGRSESATDSAPITMVETTVRLRPREQWRMVEQQRWYSSWAPEWLQAALRPVWPDSEPISWDALTAEMNSKMQFPGWTNAWTMPIKTRVDMLTTGVRTPVGIKVFGNDLTEIEKIGTKLEELLSPVPGTRSVLYERSLGGLYLDIVPRSEVLARYGLRTGDVQRVIESAIGGLPITTTVEGRNRFTVNVRYPQDLRSDPERLREVLVPIPMAADPAAPPRSATGSMSGQGAAVGRASTGILLAQGMPDMSAGAGRAPAAPMARFPESKPMSDAPGMDTSSLSMPSPSNSGGMSSSPSSGSGRQSAPAGRRAYVPLGELADIRIVEGPPMVRDEDGLLVGYVYVDIDQATRDLGGYVDAAKRTVQTALDEHELTLPPGYALRWTGQYEALEETSARMRVIIPITLMIIVLLLYLHFQNIIEVLIVLLSIPFALVGSVWLLWLLDYRVSTAVWIGVIALVGLAAQTGIVMIVYIDNAYERRKRAGKIRDLNDIIWAHMEGTVLRVRPKLMTVSTMLLGLVPLLWATGSGSDVMKRIAAPMVGGLLTSAFLTLEIIPVVYTYWRLEQLLWELLPAHDAPRLRKLQRLAWVHAAGWTLLVSTAIALIYLEVPRGFGVAGVVLSAGLVLVSALAYLLLRPTARRLVWPRPELSADLPAR